MAILFVADKEIGEMKLRGVLTFVKKLIFGLTALFKLGNYIMDLCQPFLFCFCVLTSVVGI